MRIEVNVSTGEVKSVPTKTWFVDGVALLIDDGKVVPQGAVSAEEYDQQPRTPEWSVLDFLELFTHEEQLAITQASMSSATIKLWYDKTLAASFVTISDPRVSAGLSALVAADLLAEQRMGEIVSAMSA